MKTVVVEHLKLIMSPSYRGKMRKVLVRAHNFRGQANGVRVSVIHQGDCCSIQAFSETESTVIGVDIHA
jgi:hypothetical protein